MQKSKRPTRWLSRERRFAILMATVQSSEEIMESGLAFGSNTDGTPPQMLPFVRQSGPFLSLSLLFFLSKGRTIEHDLKEI